jgi:hypothetical protein
MLTLPVLTVDIAHSIHVNVCIVQTYLFVSNGSESFKCINMSLRVVMGLTSSLAGTSSLKFVPLKESFTESRSIVPQLHTALGLHCLSSYLEC